MGRRSLLLLGSAAALFAQVDPGSIQERARQRVLVDKAENLAKLGELSRAVSVLQELYDAASQELNGALLRPSPGMKKILASEAFETSRLAVALNRESAESKERRKAAAQRMMDRQRPPQTYAAKGACPFECCVYREWNVEENVELYDSPGGTRQTGLAAKGEQVEGLTGEVHLSPTPVLVRYRPPYSQGVDIGDVVFILDYRGEGHANIWHEGRIIETDVLSVEDHCMFPGEDCWGEYLDPSDAEQRPSVWWVKVRTSSGAVGWTDKPQNFSNKDACG